MYSKHPHMKTNWETGWIGFGKRCVPLARHILATVPDLTYVYMYISCTMMEVSQRLIYTPEV